MMSRFLSAPLLLAEPAGSIDRPASFLLSPQAQRPPGNKVQSARTNNRSQTQHSTVYRRVASICRSHVTASSSPRPPTSRATACHAG